MKFFCDQCNAQYMIADEKVGPRGVKVKCKKCSHVILVKPLLAGDATTVDRSPLEDQPRPAQPAASPASKGDITNAFDSLFNGDEKPATDVSNAWSGQATTVMQSPLSAAAAGGGQAAEEGEREWYVAIDDAQVGPISLSEVAQRWDAREVNEDTLAWKAGLPDWVPISEIPELSHLARERPQKRAGTTPNQTSSSSSGTGAAVASPAAAAAKVAANIEWKPSAASALSSLVQEELIAASAPKESAQAKPPEGTPDLGLPKYGTNDLFGGQVGSQSAPAPAPDNFGGGAAWSVPTSRPSSGGNGLYIGLGIGFLALIVVGGFAFFGYVLLNKQNAPPPQQVAMAPQHPAATPPPATPPPTQQPTTATPPPQQQAAPEAKPAPQDEEDDGHGGKRKGKRRAKEGHEGHEGHNGAGGGGGGAPAAAPAAAPPPDAGPVKASLSKDDIWGVVRHNASKAAPCLKAARGRNEIAAGSYTFTLDWTIGPSGAVSAAQLKGPPAVLASSLPQCFAAVVSQWRFPASQAGAPIRNFPFGPITVP